MGGSGFGRWVGGVVLGGRDCVGWVRGGGLGGRGWWAARGRSYFSIGLFGGVSL